MDRLRNKLKLKIKSTKAFTIAEALVATIIMLLVSIIMVTGIPAAIRAYDNVVTAANAEVLLSTTMSALRNELCTAKNVEVNDNNTAINYYNVGFGTQSEISRATGAGSSEKEGTIMYRRYAPETIIEDAYKDSGAAKRLISKEASDKEKDLYITFEKVYYDDGIVTFTNLTVKKDGNDTPASRAVYSIRVLCETEGQE